MKKITIITILAIFSIGFSFNYALAVGSFELIDFPDSFNAVAGQKFLTSIDFFYSGAEYIPRISVVSKNFPVGLDISSSVPGGGNLYNAIYSGTPKQPGDYKLLLTLTDNYGAQLNKNFAFKVSGLVFNNDPLPNAIVNKLYSYNVKFDYAGSDDPIIMLYDIPSDFQIDYLSTYGRNGNFTLKFIPRKTGQFSFTAKATVNGADLGMKVFNLNVDDSNQTQVVAPIIIPVVTSAQIVPSTKPQEVIIKTTEVLKKEIIKENKKTTDTTKVTKDIPVVADQTININPIQSNPEPVKKIKWYQKIFNWFRGK